MVIFWVKTNKTKKTPSQHSLTTITRENYTSRTYFSQDVHAKVVLTGGLHQRFPDLVDVNFDLVVTGRSVRLNLLSIKVAVVEEEPVESIVVLKLDLPPYVDIGAVFVPQTLTKRRLITQTSIDMVCGPEGEVCACCHNGYELLSGRKPLLMMETSLPAGSRLNHKWPLALRRREPCRLLYIWVGAYCPIAVLQLQPELTTKLPSGSPCTMTPICA